MAGMGQSSVISLVFLTASASIGLYDICNEMRQSGTTQRGTKAHIYEYHDYQEQRLRSNTELPETCSPYQKENSHLHRRRSWLSLQNGSSLLLRNVTWYMAVPQHTSHYKDGARKKGFHPPQPVSFLQSHITGEWTEQFHCPSTFWLQCSFQDNTVVAIFSPHQGLTLIASAYLTVCWGGTFIKIIES